MFNGSCLMTVTLSHRAKPNVLQSTIMPRVLWILWQRQQASLPTS